MSPSVDHNPPQMSLSFQLAHQLPFPFMVLSCPDFVVQYVNPRYEKVTGRTAEMVLGKPFELFILEANRETVMAMLATVAENGTTGVRQEVPVHFEEQGQVFHEIHRVEYTPYRNEAGKIIAIIATGSNITNQVRARQTAQRNENRLRVMLDEAPAAICVLQGPNLELTLANQAFLNTLRINHDALGMPLEVAAPEVCGLNPMAVAALKNVFATGEAFHHAMTAGVLPYKGGLKTRYFNISYIPLRNTQGEVEELLGIGIDVTEQRNIQQSLQTTKDQLELTLENVPSAIYLFDSTGGVAFANKAAKTLMVEVLGQEYVNKLSLSDMFREGMLRTRYFAEDGSPLTPFQSPVARAFASGQPAEAIFMRQILATGKETWVINRATPLLDKEGRVQWVMASSTDITDQKVSESAIRQSEERFRNTFNNAAVGIAHVDLNGKLILLNQRFCEIVGYSREELERLRFQDITHPEDLNTDLVLVEELALGKIPHYDLEKRYVRKDGSIIWVNLTVGMVRNAEGLPQYFVSVIEDISQRKQAEEQIAESEQRYKALAGSLEQQVALRTAELQQSRRFLQSILDSTQNGIISHQPLYDEAGKIQDFRCVFANDRVHHDFDMQPGTLPGKTMQEVFPFAFTDGTFDRLRRVVETGEADQFQLVVPKQNQDIYFEVKAVKLEEGVTLTATNITHMKMAALELEALNQELQRSNADLQQFAHVASHDLKEPVRKIRTFTSRLQQELNDHISDAAKSYLDKVMSASTRMIKMIDGVLEYSTINATHQPFEPVNLGEVLRQIEHDLEVLLHQKDATLQTHNLPTVTGAPFLLYQLFYNLVNNSLKFVRPQVPPLIAVSATTTEKDGKPFTRIEVRDNGIGFDQAHASTIFGTFTRLHSKDKFEGTGLGLALCQKIVERHHGTIHAEGSLNEGACFVIELPL